ncbi:flagellar biosynthesis protein FlgD [Clostridium swellfunianum]|uniref:flagellar hook capping FlgD N-terminal domain-containing protein n=1 Tax=Clostridium swellfunianum TaxID=1367462 RepID=UPI0020306DAF|nr:flagellar hook capping FlgD N-terminal domain-containing protein [Clostridium swellfunianum]MCM0650445.1 flagellar biosynthesis protein FlgD [Clostridium swellfunianum]
MEVNTTSFLSEITSKDTKAAKTGINLKASDSAVGATSKGTKIVKPGNEMDKNAFLKILTAELSNQNPDNAKDSTQYVAQMAQFASLEQMSNLNSTMRMSSANSLIGKFVALRQTDFKGIPYTGTVQSVSKSGSNVILSVQVIKDGKSEVMEVDYSDVTDVADMPDYNQQALNENLLLLTSSSLIGKKAEFADKDAAGNIYKGTINGVFIDGNTVKLKVQVENSEEIVELPYTSLRRVEK